MVDVSSLITAAAEVVASKPADYVYGAVEAPPVVPIIGAILAILTAAVPFLLKPGEDVSLGQRVSVSVILYATTVYKIGR
jgi:hypothetical protein